MTGNVIFLTITALPDSDVQTSFALNALLLSNRRRIASATALASMIAPSTIESGGTGCVPKAATRYPFPAAFSSTALTALDPMSRPTTVLDLANTENLAAKRPVERADPYNLRKIRSSLEHPSSLFIGR